MIKEFLQDARKRYKITRETPQLWRFPEHGFGYIQIPKVATRSIREALLTVDGSNSEGSEGFSAFEERFSQHVARNRVRQEVAGLKVFAFVRDPFARLYSAYVNKVVDAERLGRKNILSCHGIRFGMSFDAFVERVCSLDDGHIDRHLRSQAWFLTDEQGVIPHFIGHLESFPQDWQRLCEQLPVLGAVGHRNRAAGDTDFRSHYSAHALELTRQRYARDFELFGYKAD